MAKGSRKKSPPRKIVEWDGEKFNLAVIVRGNKLPDDERLKIAEVVCKMYESDDYSLDDCLNFVGISSRTSWYNWMDEVEQIEQMYKTAQRNKDRMYRHKLKERARTRLEMMIDGYVFELTERVADVSREGGGVIPRTIKRKEIYVRPSERLLERVLFNVDPLNFERDPKPYERDVDIDIPVTKWIEPPVDDDLIEQIDFDEE
jgi:hypothetical protein